MAQRDNTMRDDRDLRDEEENLRADDTLDSGDPNDAGLIDEETAIYGAEYYGEDEDPAVDRSGRTDAETPDTRSARMTNDETETTESSADEWASDSDEE